VPPADHGRRPASDEHGSGPLGDHGGVHRVIEVGVHRRHGVEPVDAGPRERGVDPCPIGGDPA
jgi:hypothetical protein